MGSPGVPRPTLGTFGLERCPVALLAAEDAGAMVLLLGASYKSGGSVIKKERENGY